MLQRSEVSRRKLSYAFFSTGSSPHPKIYFKADFDVNNNIQAVQYFSLVVAIQPKYAFDFWSNLKKNRLWTLNWCFDKKKTESYKLKNFF